MTSTPGWGRGLDKLIDPQSIAVVGASGNPERVGGRPLRYLRKYGFPGRAYGVNPNQRELDGYLCVPDIAALPEPVDLAVVCLPAADVVSAVEACAACGIGAAVVFASGFAESGPEGKERQTRLTQIAQQSGMRILGPNTNGYRNQNKGIFATFATDLNHGMRPGRAAIVSQSGSMAGYFGVMLQRMAGLGTRYVIDTSNEADVDVAECVEYLSRDPEVSVIGLSLEGCRDGRRLVEAIAIARSRNKPVVVLKIGRTEHGARQVQSHTGVLAGVDRVWDAALSAAGAIRAADEIEFADVIKLFSVDKSPEGRRMGFLTTSGGVGTIMIDACSDLGLTVPPIEPPPESLTAQLPALHFANPLDCTGHIGNVPSSIGPLLAHLHNQTSIDSVAFWVTHALHAPGMGQPFTDQIIAAAAASSKPTYVLGSAPQGLQDRLAEAGVPVFPSPTLFLRAMDKATRFPVPSLPIPLSVPLSPITSHPPRVLTGPAAQEALAGLPMARMRSVTSAEGAVSLATELGYPVVMKGEADGVAHKSELGLVRVGLRDAEAVHEAYDSLTSALEASGLQGVVVIQPMVRGVECFAGLKVDPLFGPVVTVGLGGILVDYLRDVAVLLAPVTAESVLAALTPLQGFPILCGVRGQPPCDLDALAQVVAQLSNLPLTNSRVREVDLNPIMVGPVGSGALAVDAVVVVADAS